MMTERGVAVDHSTIYRWVQRFAPEMEMLVLETIARIRRDYFGNGNRSREPFRIRVMK